MAITAVGSYGAVGATSATSGSPLTMNPSSNIVINSWLLVVVGYRSFTGTGSPLINSSNGSLVLELENLINDTSTHTAGTISIRSTLFYMKTMGLPTTDTIRLTVSGGTGTINDPCMGAFGFSSDYNTRPRQDGSATNEVTATNGYGSASLSSLENIQRISLRACAKQANSTTALTASTNFTSFGWTVRSRNNASATILRGEYRLNSSTGETSNPTHAVSGDAISHLRGISEYKLLDPGGSAGVFGI